MPIFFVHWNYGNCNDGSHDTGLEEFDTLLQAIDRREELEDRHGESCDITVIQGDKIELT